MADNNNGASAQTPTIPDLLTPYKMGKFNLSHRYFAIRILKV